ncbi:MAG: LysR family transcriptional regulator, partial [Halieaceae bacterium]|nr:LysR family transcriptional regulator [Halieaceae bacterium]
SAAARRLGQSAPAVTRAIAGLEDHLGVKLLNRTTRYVRATEAGIRYLEDARRILAEVEAAEDAAAGINAEPRGMLSVTAPVLFGRRYVMPGIVDYLTRYPEMQVDAVFLDRPVNLLEEGLDVGVRIGELADSSMRARRVGSVRQQVLASPAYLEERGTPETPHALNLHRVIASSAGNFGSSWRFQFPDGEQHVRVRPRLTVTSNDAALEAAIEGFGITRLLSYQAADAIAAGELVPILEPFAAPDVPVHIIHRSGPQSPGKVRSFIDLMAERLRADPALAA